MENEKYERAINISFTKSGIFYKLLVLLGFDGTSNKDYIRRLLAICGAVWAPLLILCLLQGLAFGSRVEIPFVRDFANNVKFLIIIPILIFSERAVDFRLNEFSDFFFTAGILNESDVNKWNKIYRSIRRLAESLFADIVILLIIAFNISIRWSGRPTTSSYWILNPGGQQEFISWAGWWYLFISIPIFQYLWLRWVWRWILWLVYFRKIAGLPLKLNPAHPDRAGGLGFLGLPPGPFLFVTLALSILFSVVVAEKIFYFHSSLKQYYPVLGGIVLIAILVNILPLMVFLKPLFIHRRRGIFQYSALIQEHHREFDNKWIDKKNDDQILGTSDPSSMIDINSSFESVENMRLFPFDLRIILSSILVVLLPLLPLIFFEYKLSDLVQQIFKLLF